CFSRTDSSSETPPFLPAEDNTSSAPSQPFKRSAPPILTPASARRANTTPTATSLSQRSAVPPPLAPFRCLSVSRFFIAFQQGRDSPARKPGSEGKETESGHPAETGGFLRAK